MLDQDGQCSIWDVVPPCCPLHGASNVCALPCARASLCEQQSCLWCISAWLGKTVVLESFILRVCDTAGVVGKPTFALGRDKQLTHLLVYLSRSALVETDHVWGVDCDEAALERARCNIQDQELQESISLVCANVGLPLRHTTTANESSVGAAKKGRSSGGGTSSRGKGGSHRHGRGRGGGGGHARENGGGPAALTAFTLDTLPFPIRDGSVDTVLTNPPFGTKPDKAGMDVQFLLLGCRLARRAVYSFHKSSTRDYIVRTASAVANVTSVSVIAEMKFDLPQTYKFHQKASVDIAVDLIRVELACETDSSKVDEVEAELDGLELRSDSDSFSEET
jgi:predicted RNA methylase